METDSEYGSDYDSGSDAGFGRFDAPLLPKTKRADPLFEPLLGSESQDQSIYIHPEQRRVADAPFTFLYLACFLVMIVLGAIAAAGTGTLPGSSIISKTLYFTLSENALTIALLTALSVAAGALWLALLSRFARPIIAFTAVAIPASIMVVSLATCIVSINASWSPKPDTGSEIHVLLGASVVGLLVSIWVAFYIWKRRAMIDTMTHIIELSCDVLHLNPSLFTLSIALMIAHTLFSILWLFLFSRLFLVGTVERPIIGGPKLPELTDKDASSPRFIPSNQTPLVATFFVVMYFWTSSIFENLQKTTVASVVGGWYFLDIASGDGDNDGGSSSERDQTLRNFRAVSTKSFGSIAAASLILGTVRAAKFIVGKMRQNMSARSQIMQYISSVLTLISAILDEISSYALVHTGLTGAPFLESAYTCTRLFRRNLILGLVTQGVTRILGGLGRVLVSSIVGLAVFWRAVDGTGTGSEWVAACVATVVPYYVVGVLTRVVENTVDATFICYLIDLDTNSCHCEGAHRIFSESLS